MRPKAFSNPDSDTLPVSTERAEPKNHHSPTNSSTRVPINIVTLDLEWSGAAPGSVVISINSHICSSRSWQESLVITRFWLNAFEQYAAKQNIEIRLRQ
jgi:hypothetical protein